MFPNSTLFDADIYPLYRPQLANLIAKEDSTKVFVKYANFLDVFFLDLSSKLPEHTGINNYAIELINSQQLPYRSIYSLKLVELETLKAYIKTNLASKFIKSSKSYANTPIFFDWKLNRSFLL